MVENLKPTERWTNERGISLQARLNTRRSSQKGRPVKSLFPNIYSRYLWRRHAESAVIGDIPLFLFLILSSVWCCCWLTRADRPISFLSSRSVYRALIPVRGAALAADFRCDVRALRHLVIILRVDNTVERTVELNVNRQSRTWTLNFQIFQICSVNGLCLARKRIGYSIFDLF